MLHVAYWAAFVASLVCFIIVLVRMFQSGNTGLGIATIILGFCCYIGGIIAFVWGWMNAPRLGLQKVMLVWTIAWVVKIALVGVSFAVSDPVIDVQKLQQQLGR
jgi:hypothetical protein